MASFERLIFLLNEVSNIAGGFCCGIFELWKPQHSGLKGQQDIGGPLDVETEEKHIMRTITMQSLKNFKASPIVFCFVCVCVRERERELWKIVLMWICHLVFKGSSRVMKSCSNLYHPFKINSLDLNPV